MRKIFIIAVASLALCAIVAPASAQQASAPGGYSRGVDADGYVGVTLQQLLLALGVALQGGKAVAHDVNLARRMRPGAEDDDEAPHAPMIVDPPRSPSLAVLPHPAP